MHAGEIYGEAGEELDAKLLAKLKELGLKEIPILDIDHVNVGPYIRNTLAADKNSNREEALLDIYRGQQEHTWIKNSLEEFEAALERAGLYSRLQRPPAVSFLDITGYTKLTEERGDKAAAELATRLSILVRRSSQEHGGQPVKWLGDGVMFYLPGRRRALGSRHG